MNCSICKNNLTEFVHPKYSICSFDCLKLLVEKTKPKAKFNEEVMLQKGRGKSHVIWMKQKKKKKHLITVFPKIK